MYVRVRLYGLNYSSIKKKKEKGGAFIISYVVKEHVRLITKKYISVHY